MTDQKIKQWTVPFHREAKSDEIFIGNYPARKHTVKSVLTGKLDDSNPHGFHEDLDWNTKRTGLYALDMETLKLMHDFETVPVFIKKSEAENAGYAVTVVEGTDAECAVNAPKF